MVSQSRPPNQQRQPPPAGKNETGPIPNRLPLSKPLRPTMPRSVTTDSSGTATPTPSSWNIPKSKKTETAVHTDDSTPTQSRFMSTGQLPSPPNTIRPSTPSNEPSPPSEEQRPQTPVLGRQRNPRYPESLSRVPLHRRGTASKYETMEDLLREAGYKETRVFTPEMERLEAEADERREREQRRGSVMQFFSRLMSSSKKDNEASSSSTLSSPTSSTFKREDPPSPTPVRKRSSMGQGSSSTLSESVASSIVRTKRSRNSNVTAPPSSYQKSQSQNHIRPSTSRAQLRHMASAPTMKRNLNSSDSVRATGSLRYASTRATYSTSNIHQEAPPSLPKNWYSTVTNAMLFGSTTSPTTPPSNRSSKRTSGNTSSSNLQTPYSIRSRGRRVHRQPSLLFVSPSKSIATTTLVSPTRVVVRSSPSSRGASRARSDLKKQNFDSLRRRKKAHVEAEVPVLARTTTENDGWDEEVDLGELPVNEGDTDIEDEDDHELDLARMLVDPKRENSILSLRKHLPPSNSSAASSSGKRRNAKHRADEDSERTSLLH